MPKSKQESETSPAQMVEVISSKTKHHEHLMTASDRVLQEEQVVIDRKVEVDKDTSTKPDNQIVGDTMRSKQLVNNNTVRGGDNEEQNEAPNLPSCEKEAEYALDNDNESICTVYISELDDLLLPKDRKSIDEALECERSLRLEMCLVLQ